MRTIPAFLFALTLFASCGPRYQTTGTIERLDPALDALIAPAATIEVIAEGFEWSEGPVWNRAQNELLFSDVPANAVFAWRENGGLREYLRPSGFTGAVAHGNEPGSNGLLINRDGQLVLCQHGNRALSVMNATLDNPAADFMELATRIQGKRFNSPNDVAQDRQGNYYFTDPPYGLAAQDQDSAKELSVNGVYRVDARGTVTLLVDSLTRPNGIALSPDQTHLYVANSDPAKARWYAFRLRDTVVTGGRVLFDASSLTSTEKGLPDGLKVDSRGNLFATGPGGVWIFDPAGKVLGKIKLSEATSNCALSPDEKTLYVTNDMQVLRIRLRK
ncbi:MAG: SMP-30/gluconolactonase/LRE family protein [Cyclobacteriaceae bacterium]|jgi:gluconolactonase|nr:SMP-30/gluconolactonase/LRE family protein [Cyclobacteriaceae bacterium]